MTLNILKLPLVAQSCPDHADADASVEVVESVDKRTMIEIRCSECKRELDWGPARRKSLEVAE